ncbi:MAG TPA: LacI family DNA-binding transcriptional regulator [Amycolatopsis sp.]|uniref:LacI family DNA-binding transcriptional regulator n=1 Tax=Amycolatopsis sp. TaxID=37632 RepID=UPI002B47FC6E|nr:LacI family DNA-binding transcriptional regulator [Amycolatopsis sp.]HKS44345.1 LacI family DNA-binding transcriptional regulator [Amycolatopsis sp.]
MKRPTMSDIARAAGVSKGAVSYALNGRPGVSEPTRARVLRIAKELGWVPNSAARALSAAKAGAIGLVLARPARILGLEPFFMQLISGSEAVLAERSLALVLQVVPDVVAECEVYRRWWAAHRVDGVIMVDQRVSDPRLDVLTELGLPAVVVGGHTGHPGLGSVGADDSGAMRSLVGYLAALGHRRIARVAGQGELRHIAARTAVFEQVTVELKVEASMLHGDFTGEEGARLARQLLSRTDRPTAILFDNDVMAVAGLAVAQEMGLAVPAELSIVSWDDSPLCRLVHPPLTALARDIPALGATAARTLAEILDGGAPAAIKAAPLTLTVRGSTGRCAKIAK